MASILIVLGLTSSIALALAAAALGPAKPDEGPQDRMTGLGPEPGTWRWLVSSGRSFAHRMVIFRRANLGEGGDERWPATIGPGELPGWVNRPEKGMFLRIDGYGWPMPCLAGRNQSGGGPEGFVIVRRGQTPADWWYLPTRPLALGMVINTAITAGVWWLVLLGAGALRRMRRRRHGRCIDCGYDLHATFGDNASNGERRCPECGRAFTTK